MSVVQTLIDKWAEERKEKALAARLGVGPTTLSAYKHGSKPMPAYKFLQLLEVLEVPNKADLALQYLQERAGKLSKDFKKLLHLGKPRQTGFYAVV